MLKIKDNVDLKELEKFGFVENDDEYYYYFENEYYITYLCVDYKGMILTDFVIYESVIEPMVDLLFDLTQAGLVEKVVDND
jgi:hypothetical protein